MILTKKRIVTVIIIIFAVGIAVGGIKKYVSIPTFSDNNLKIVVDAGHGEPDGGAVGANGTLEKDINLAIAKKLQEILEGTGAEVIMTRDGDSGIYDESESTIRKMKVSDMRKRLDIIKKSGADLFLSIHMNSFSDSSVNGLHIFYDKNHPDIEPLAKMIQENISSVTGASAHAVKTADEKLFLMKQSPVPAVLVECGFLSNPEEEQKLKSDEYQAKIAWAIAKSLENYTN